MKTGISHKQPTRLGNVRCAYCNDELDKSNKDKEHVIGRKFVPTGTFDQQWNLILNSCKSCNNIKSDLEDDISAITMGPLLRGGNSINEAHLEAARNKASKAFSRRTGKLVSESHERLKASFKDNRVEMSFGFVAPPQVDDDRAFQLAAYQLQGFFYFLTFDHMKKVGWQWPGSYIPCFHVGQTDWGNSAIIGFAEATKDWDLRLSVWTAQEFYKVLIKKHPSHELWSWAMEWNESTRIAGFLGSEDHAKAIYAEIPQPRMKAIVPGEGKPMRYRLDVPLRDGDEDMLFFVSDELP